VPPPQQARLRAAAHLQRHIEEEAIWRKVDVMLETADRVWG
jgi:hypothetical protein